MTLSSSAAGHHLLPALAARLSHDLNNATAILGGHLYLLRHSSDPAEESYATMERSIAQIQRLSRSLARLGALGAEEMAPFDLNEVVRSVAEEHPRPVRLELDENLPKIRGRPADAREALKALLENAAEACPANGTIRVSTDWIPDRSEVLVAVEDSGPGIRPEIRDRVFDPFCSTKGEKGRGIGLTLVATFAAAHGASCEVSDLPQGGARVVLRFPAGAAPNSAEDYRALAERARGQE